MKNNTLDPWYQSLLSLLVSKDQSFSKSDRTGTGTKSLFGVQFRHDMSDGFPLLTTKKVHFKSVVTELLWFLKGSTDIRELWKDNCHIWDGDYNKSGRTDFDLGPIYGKQWRSWKKVDEVWDERLIPPFKIENIELIDQIANLINELKTNPDSRRLMVNSWNVGELGAMVLPPCHYGFQMYTRELSFNERHLLYCKSFENTNDTHKGSSDTDKMTEYHNNRNIPTRAISLMWNQRSVDTALGLPMNIASYALLLMMIADEVNMVPDQLIGNLGDVHLYNDHVEQAKEQIGRTPFQLPTVHVRDGIESCMDGDIILEYYQSHPSIKAPLSN